MNLLIVAAISSHRADVALLVYAVVLVAESVTVCVIG